MNSIDLQIQSTASDGKIEPRELVRMAKERGLAVISITDHDTVGGVAEAIAADAEFGVRVIPGIEMSVEEHDLHILGYGVDIAHAALLTELEKFRLGRIEGAKKMVENLRRAGFVLTWMDVERQAKSGVIARPHVARAILENPLNKGRLGGVTSVHDFIERHLSNESPHYVRRAHISAKDAIALMNRAGGVAVWSHPAIHFRDDSEGLEAMLKELIGWGLEGLELCNPSHTEDDMELLAALAAKYRLLVTAGSDFHDIGNHTRDARGLHSADTVGDYETYGFSLDTVIANLDAAITRRAERGVADEKGI
ncbi:MAG: PHP domain-containing protein [bacterium]|nr:PHP domain-containing protein [bacterium]MDZ4299641.1 PHP domain-containing protein [Candidatus Sungbacteria bacterium]